MSDDEVREWLSDEELKQILDSGRFALNGVDASVMRALRTLAETRKALLATYGHDVYEFGCPLCKRGAPHADGCLIATMPRPQ